jgi:hypothetical protein
MEKKFKVLFLGIVHVWIIDFRKYNLLHEDNQLLIYCICISAILKTVLVLLLFDFFLCVYVYWGLTQGLKHVPYHWAYTRHLSFILKVEKCTF